MDSGKNKAKTSEGNISGSSNMNDKNSARILC